MIASAFILIVKIVAVFAMLAAMVMLLVGIRHIAGGNLDVSDADTLRKEVDDDDTVISQHNLFHRFIDSDERHSKTSGRRNY
ncbi:MAG: hypothetical protein HDS82_05945 [Bacteroidales bacterium]|nr:hypothetical protein [Bacteroidales bacterium]